MTNTIDDHNQLTLSKGDRPLAARQKLLFTMVCWGVQSWSQAEYFRANGYDQKYKDARKSMHTGLAIYGSAITIFFLVLFS